MRLREPTIMKGFFWKASDAEHKYPGILTISDGGVIELELTVDSPRALKAFETRRNGIRIIGHVQNAGYVTLDKCHKFSPNINMKGIHTIWLSFERVVSGVAFDEGDSIDIQSMSFTVENLQDWIGLSGFDRTELNNQPNSEEIIISYRKLPTKRFELGDGLVLEMIFYCPAFINSFEARIVQGMRLHVRSETPKPLEDVKIVCHRVVDFLSLVMNQPLMIENVTVQVPMVEQGIAKSHQADVFYPSPLIPNKVTKQQSGHLFGFKEVESHFEDVLQKWLLMYDRLEPIYNLYFSVQFGYHQTLNGQFLALAQVLEVFYKRMYTDGHKKVDFITKLKSLFEIYFHTKSMSLDFDQKKSEDLRRWLNNLAQKILDTRNYLTHYNLKYEQSSNFARGGDLKFLYRFMTLIFQAHVLKQLGFDELQVKDFIDN